METDLRSPFSTTFRFQLILFVLAFVGSLCLLILTRLVLPFIRHAFSELLAKSGHDSTVLEMRPKPLGPGAVVVTEESLSRQYTAENLKLSSVAGHESSASGSVSIESLKKKRKKCPPNAAVKKQDATISPEGGTAATNSNTTAQRANKQGTSVVGQKPSSSGGSLNATRRKSSTNTPPKLCKAHPTVSPRSPNDCNNIKPLDVSLTTPVREQRDCHPSPSPSVPCDCPKDVLPLGTCSTTILDLESQSPHAVVFDLPPATATTAFSAPTRPQPTNSAPIRAACHSRSSSLEQDPFDSEEESFLRELGWDPKTRCEKLTEEEVAKAKEDLSKAFTRSTSSSAEETRSRLAASLAATTLANRKDALSFIV